jgi:hypothetical protein
VKPASYKPINDLDQENWDMCKKHLNNPPSPFELKSLGEKGNGK